MASAANAVKTFHGSEGEDINLWLKEVKLISTLAGFNDTQTASLILFRLRERAQTWAAGVFIATFAFKQQT